jgi:hypothetical protein
LSDLPTAKNYLNNVLPILQKSTASVETRHEIANAVLFQVMRLLFLKEAHLVSKVFMAKKELMKVAREKAALAAKASESGEVSEEIKSEDTDSINDKSVELEIRVLQQAIKIINDDEEARRSNAAKATINETSAQTQTSTSPALNSPPKVTVAEVSKDAEGSNAAEEPASSGEVPNQEPSQGTADHADIEEVTNSDLMKADTQAESEMPTQNETQAEGKILSPNQEEGEMQLDVANGIEHKVADEAHSVMENSADSVLREEEKRHEDTQNVSLSENLSEETVKGSAMEVDDTEENAENVPANGEQSTQ